MLLLGGGAAAGQATHPLPVISDLKKKREKKKRLWQARPYTHTPLHIYTEGGAGATLNPPKHFLSAASFFCLLYFFLFEVPASRETGGKGSSAIREDLSSELYSVARVCPCARVPQCGFSSSGL